MTTEGLMVEEAYSSCRSSIFSSAVDFAANVRARGGCCRDGREGRGRQDSGKMEFVPSEWRGRMLELL